MLRKFACLLFLQSALHAQTATVDATAGGASDSVNVTIIVDSDRDGLTDAQEATLGTDPGNPDTDGDGLTDKAEVDAGKNPLVNQFAGDPDGYGLPASANQNLKIRYDFESTFANQGSNYFPDVSGSGNNGRISGTIPLMPGIASKSAELSGSSYVEIPESFWQYFLGGTYTASLFFEFSSLSTNTRHALFGGAHYDASGFLSSVEYYLWNDGTNVYLICHYSYPGGQGPCSSGYKLAKYTTWTWLLGSNDALKDKFHHIAVLSSRVAWFNGQQLASPVVYTLPDPPQPPGVPFAPCRGPVPSAADLSFSWLGRYPLLAGVGSFPGKFDRFRFYSSLVNSTTIQALANIDTDGDGTNDRTEYVNGWDVLHYSKDADRDGLTNAEEAAGQAVFNGALKVFGATDPNYFDSDSDLFDDYWEAKYYRAGFVDPNNPTVPVPSGDYDGDGLSNWDEFINGTSPVAVDSNGNGVIDPLEEAASRDTDGDGISDADEADFGSSPLDGADKPLDPSDFYGDENLGSYAPIGDLGVTLKAGAEDSPLVTAQVGDDSDSHSERWRLLIGDKQLVAQTFGQLSPKTDFALDPTDFHEVTIQHVGTDPTYLQQNGSPDYDYTATVEPAKKSPFLLCDLDGLLGAGFQDVDPQEVGYKKAYLVPLDSFSWATSYSGGDAVGPKYRKVSLNGRPMPDEKPQQEEESDLPDEETYIDAFNLGLHHDTTFAYTPLGASDLVIQASASTEETGFSDRSGLRPNERFDLPFGVGWTSSLCSYVEVIETIGGEATDPVTVNVVDEAGRPQRFGTVDFHNFFPWPSTRVDKKTYLNTLARNGDRFVLQKKFGNTLTYAKAKTWFMYSTDRLEGSTQVKRHTYWRLTEARDRYGVRLHYNYDEPGVPNEVSLIPHEISSPDRPNQFLVINRSADYRRVDSITDSRGNTTVFNYDTTTALGFETYPGVVGDSGVVPRLTGIDFADNTSTSYDYHGGLEVEVDNSDPQNPRQTLHYHANVDSITDKRGNTHQFTYAFDQTKQYWDSSVNGTRAAIDLDRLPTDVKDYVEQQLADMNDEANGSWKTMYGMPRRVTQVTLPGTLGSSSFSPQGAMRFGQTVSFTTLPKTTVTDAAGNATVYEFTDMDAEIVDVDATSKSVSAEWMVYYLTSEIHHYQGAPGTGTLLGTEKYEFDKASGLSLWRATDFSGNPTTWEYGDDLAAQPSGLGKAAATVTMTKWADPTAKIDALGRREEYTYSGNYRVMDGNDDPYATNTVFDVDGLGRRKSKTLTHGASILEQERYDYGNQRFKAFQTGTTKLAFASVSGQAWETDLATSYLPDDRGRLWREIVDPQGLKLTTEHTYDFNNKMTSTLDARGNRTRFAYDKLNRLIEVTYPSAGTRSGESVATKQNWYDLNGNKAAEIDEEGHYTIFHYDALNRRVKTIRDMDGQGLPSRNGDGLVEEASKGTATGNDLVTEVRYDSVNNVTHSIDPNGNVTFTVFDAIRRPVHVFTGLTLAEAADLGTATAAAAASTEKTHTEFKYTDAGLNLPLGGTVKANPGGTAFDSSGFKPTELIRHNAVLTATGTTTLHTYAAYDALYRPLRTETEYEANTYAVSFTAYGTIAAGKEALQTSSTDDRGKVTVTIMDGLQRATSVTDAYGTTLAATSQTVYSSTGLVWKTIDPLLRETETEYDAAGRSVAVWQPDPFTGLVNRSTPNDPLLGSPRTQTAYDKNNNVTVTINPLGYRWEYEYDARNRKTVERQPTVTSTTIVNGQPQESVLQNPVIQTAFDGVGNVIAVTDARNHITRTFHDFAYRVTDILTNPVTGNPSTDPQTPGPHDILVHTVFDANGNALEVTDGNGNATRNQYDALNRLVATATNPNDGDPNAPPAAPKADDIVVSNQYDDAGNLVKVTDGEGHITGFRWDGMSRKTRTLWDEGSAVQRTEQASYDGLVQLTRTDPKNQLTTYQYDALNRLENTLYTGAATDNRHYEYDLVGNLLAVTYPNETAARQILRGANQVFDKLNRLKEETSAGATHVHTYDKANNRRSTTYAATGRTLASAYDKLNRLLTLTENGTAATSYGYDLSGNITRKVLPNGTETRCTFDALNRKLGETSQQSSGAVISSFDYSQAVAPFPNSYDNVGSLLKAVEQYGHASVNDRTVTNTYDRTYRLDIETIAESGGSTTVTDYGYDDANNRTGKIVTVDGGTPTSWTFLHGTLADGYNSNQLKSASDDTTTTTFLYDSNGNRSEKQVGGVTTQTYAWDHDNRLTQVVDSTLGTYTYSYDHRTRRVGRDESQAGGQSTELSFAGGLSVQEYTTGNGTPNVELIRGSDYGGGIGGVLYTIRGPARSYNAYNSRGDVVSQTDESAAITWQSSYEAFGTRTQEQGSTADRQKANTKDEDPTGLLNEGMRIRDLEFGVFISRDPAG
ncbi:MAG: hypothetical protein ACO3JG_07700, partial [Luteolibacter sp.]